MKRQQILTSVLVLGLLLALAVGLSLAQGPEPPTGSVERETGPAAPEATMNDAVPIQGQLTHDDGTPVGGVYNLTLSLYDVETGGTALCSDTDTVLIYDGLFNFELDFCTASDIDGRQLWLGVQVGSDLEMTPRQGIYAVPYARSLRPGATISSSISGAIVHIENSHTSGRGLRSYATAESGANYGVIGASKSPDGCGGYFYNTAEIPNTGVGVAGLHPGYDLGDIGGWGHPAGFFGGQIGVIGLTKETDGTAILGLIDDADGWAGKFTGIGNGIRVSVPVGKVGLEVIDGTKSAVVRTADGSRLLYTEESTEIWFTDYGFGELEDGVAVIPIDPIFAQTVNLEDEPYHVFVQVYGNAEVYVTDRTSTQFEVHLRDGDPNVEFSYRIVATRLGYEGYRLERAPWDDNDPNLYPEKQAEWEAQQGLVEPADSVLPGGGGP